jgi:serine/threonine-protein kinase
MKRALALIALLACGPPAAFAEDLAGEAYQVLKAHCYRCHGVEFKVENLHVLDHDRLLASRGSQRTAYVVPGDPDSSKLWTFVESGLMPPGNQPLSADDQAVLRRWIEAGARPFPLLEPRKFVSEADVLGSIRDHLASLTPRDRPFQRYFTFTHLWNNPRVSAEDLRLHRAALSKAINSLSLEAAIVLPRAVDAQRTVYNVDLRKFGWDEPRLWRSLVQGYPYGYEPVQTPAVNLYKDVISQVGPEAAELPYVRGDWFVVQAVQPPRYELLLKLPETSAELEKRLNVDAAANLRRGTARRAAFSQSGVSRQSRVVERHGSSQGAYWRSFDFLRSAGKNNPLLFPLGPVSPDNEHNAFAFEHAGGEMIFSLPNGLFAYLLVDKEGKRIDKAPIDIVWDANAATGSPVIVNGLSCMGCHRQGLQPFRDAVRQGLSLFNAAARSKIEDLYVPQSDMDKLVTEDNKRYLAALSAAVQDEISPEGEGAGSLEALAEPITALTRRYSKDMTLQDVASELWFQSADELAILIRRGRDLQRLGLGALQPSDNGEPADGGKLDRGSWEFADGTESQFQEAVRALALGKPTVIP